LKLLFDQNLSRSLVRKLNDLFPESAHIASLAVDEADDRRIWVYAATHDYVLASKDSDFRQLAMLYGPPPKVVWLRVGNCGTDVVEACLRKHASSIATFIADQESSVYPIAP
jgi:predicted nuclease of predicted toxin-antitoxin system